MQEIVKIIPDETGESIHLPASLCLHTDHAYARLDKKTGDIIISRKDQSVDRKAGWEKFLKLQAEMLAAGEIPDDFLLDIRDQSPLREIDL
jgi:hypothetical protein